MPITFARVPRLFLRVFSAVAISSIASMHMASAAAPPTHPLIEAVKKSDEGALRKLLQQGGDVNAADVDGTTALHWAAYKNDLDTVKLLVQAGANVKAANRYGVRPMHLAATAGNAAMIDTLLSAGADPNEALPEGETAIMTAARSGSAASVKLLIARGAQVDVRENWRGQTALMWAAAEGHTDVVKLLIAAGADVHVRSNGTIGAGRAQVPEVAAPTAGPGPAGTAASSVEPAAPAAERATGRRASSTLLNFTPLLFAVRAGQIETVRALLDAGADANEKVSDGTSAITLAILNAHYELAALLAASGANANADEEGWTALHQLVWTRRPNVGRPPPAPVPTGNLDALELARVLLKHGADPNARQKKEPKDTNRNAMNRIDATPFLLAAKSADVEMMRVLLDGGADPTLKTVAGITPLMAAAGVGIYKVGESPGTGEEALEAVELLHELGADVNAVDTNGDTAMHGAAFRGHAPLVHFLHEMGAQLDLRNKKGLTPLAIADGIFHISVFISNPETAAMLRKLGAAEPTTRQQQ